MTAILGISAFYHDSAAALVVDGKIVAAAQEERFTRIKNDYDFPINAIQYCLREAGISAERLDYVGFYDKPFLKFERLLETYLAYAPVGFTSFVMAMPLWLRKKLYLRREMSKGLNWAYKKQYVFTEHHESHAASAFFPSPFEEAAILTLDGVGEWATASIALGRGNKIQLMHEQRFPHSLGLLYSAFTYFTGFTVNSGEYKLMGLAPYGEPKYVPQIMNLIDLKEDGSFRLDMSYFNYCQGLTMTSKKFDRLFGGPPRKQEGEITQREMDIAASIQRVTEDIMFRCAWHAHTQTGMKNLCLAGGVALNCVANGKILREGPFENVWIQPAAGDAGGALGVAQFIWHQLLNKPRVVNSRDEQKGSLLGPTYSDDEIRSFLDSQHAPYDYIADDDALCDQVAQAIADGKVIGWMQGRLEFGPRALGSRSIIGDPRNPDMQTIINLKVKFREGFRPFAPAVLAERCAEYFDMKPDQESPYMLLVAPVQDSKRVAPGGSPAVGIERLKQPRSVVQSITHVDYSARVQTVDRARHGLYRKLIEKFDEKTGCPVIVNTSFNLSWEPIVNTPREAFNTFMSCDIDLLVMGHCVLAKQAQPAFVARTVSTNDGSIRVAEPLMRCPCHGKLLRFDAGRTTCTVSGHQFVKSDGIWQMFWPHETISDSTDVTEMVKAFYEDTPFPNYDDHDSVRSLAEKARRGAYAQALNNSVRYNSTILEVGCGTGQLTNFLAIGCRRVVGADMCLNSLRLGEKFRRQHEIDRAQFVQMNLFRPAFAHEQFDLVLCNGVLHHTADPKGGFLGLVPLVKPGGHIIIGLYNTYGRLMTDMRRRLFHLTGGKARWIDPILRRQKIGEAKREAWFNDQYRHPHESKHTIDEVLEWFQQAKLEFVRGVPSVTPDANDGIANANVFEPQPVGTPLDHAIVQLQETVRGNREGGFFLMIGHKPSRRDDRREAESKRASGSSTRKERRPALATHEVG